MRRRPSERTPPTEPEPEKPEDGDPHPNVSAQGETFGHELLFAPEEPTCETCGKPLPFPDEDGDDELPGDGIFPWSTVSIRQGPDPIVFCAACSARAGVALLRSWEDEN